jgi:hypothetical protein
MTVEIGELVIKTSIDNKQTQSGDASSASSSTAARLLVKQCVEEVLQILKREKER